MPIPPKPKKYVCKKCGYKKIWKAKSDCLRDGICDFGTHSHAPDICHKCKIKMQENNLNAFDILLAKLNIQ